MISTKGRYALRVMIDLADHRECAAIPLKDIAERQDISKKYLEIIVKDLVRAGLVKGSSGKGGGYRLTKAPEEYTALEIIEASEGPVVTVACLGPDAEPCPRAAECKSLPIWEQLDAITHDFLKSKKLSDLV